jgi:hypothetical protein
MRTKILPSPFVVFDDKGGEIIHKDVWNMIMKGKGRGSIKNLSTQVGGASS